jgi:hypothetical protein
MKKSEFNMLKKGTKIWHKHYGPCEVVDHVIWGGSNGLSDPVLKPLCYCGRYRILCQTGANIPLLETSNRLVSLERPSIQAGETS